MMDRSKEFLEDDILVAGKALDVNHLSSGASISGEDKEKALLQAARSGDQECFGVLVQRYQNDLYRLAFGMVSSPAEAEDLAQETFIRAWHHLKDFRGQSSFKTWLWRILINLCRSHLRKRYLQRKVFFWQDTAGSDEDERQERQWADTGNDGDPEKSLERQHLRHAVVKARSVLSPREQEVFTLKYDQGLKISAIGELLSLSPNTVKVLLFRAAKKMAVTLKEFNK